ncbi:MAG: acetate--CoA ligase family protein [Syntrophales bacterium]|jgi:acyl-CoA synthetase (NDP forming)|nr:acetate--CoA ligase family protein [Syntrophales bacterium]
MQALEIISAAKAEGRGSLTEAESKEVLRQFGVPVVEERIAVSPEDAIQVAKNTGFPVVLKGLGTKLAHKTERGLVFLNLNSEDAVEKAARAAATSAGADLEGYLIQPMLSGHREFVAGLFHDPQFGPIVMFGLGGVFTEAIDDAVFRVAPLTKNDAEQMINEIRSQKLLGAFRGEQAVERKRIVSTLLGLSRIGMEIPDITEIDINPLLVGPEGRAVAVDALVVIGEKPAPKKYLPAIASSAIGKFFYPRSIAVIGASNAFTKWGYRMMCSIIAGGFAGEVYPVNPRGGTITGRTAFKSVAEIPGFVDLAVVTIPEDRVIELIPQLQAKGIKSMLLITSGFAETGAEGRRLQEELVQAARAADILIMGPNTMGLCNPHNDLLCCGGANVHPKPGTTTLISQSGNLGVQLLEFAEREGVGIRAFGGSGNEAMITIEDYMEAFEVDELTKTVVIYLESIKNGRRFFESARRVGLLKPVVMLKGGRTEAGHHAAVSHTGALASNAKVFNAAARQAGIVIAEQPIEMLDASAAFSSLPLPRGNRVAIMTLGGGWGVVTTDLCAENGLLIPKLSPELIANINKVLPPYWSHSNPVDLVGEFDPNIPMFVLEQLSQWDGCDAVLHLGISGRLSSLRKMIKDVRISDPEADQNFLSAVPQLLEEFENKFLAHTAHLMEKTGKPIIGVPLMQEENIHTVNDVEGSPYKAVSFLTPERAVKALSRMASYSRWRELQRQRED